jgi:hypothetical protein
MLTDLVDATRGSRHAMRALMFALVLGTAACSVTAPATPLPGEPLTMATADFQMGVGGCGGVGIPAFRLEREGDSLLFVDVVSNSPRRLVWPRGYVARLVGGMATLYSPIGTVVAREHDLIDNAGGCPRPDDSLWVDSMGTVTHPIEGAPT